MKLLLDQGLPRSAIAYLAEKGISSIHTGDCGLATAADSVILSRAREEDWIVVTLDSDFHAQLVLSRAHGPSVIHSHRGFAWKRYCRSHLWSSASLPQRFGQRRDDFSYRSGYSRPADTPRFLVVNHGNCDLTHSARKVIAGSTWAARQAGRKHAIVETKSSKPITPT